MTKEEIIEIVDQRIKDWANNPKIKELYTMVEEQEFDVAHI